MRHFANSVNKATLPAAADLARVASGMARWRGAVAGAAAEVQSQAESVTSDPAGVHLLEAIFGNSPYLTLCAVTDPGFVGTVFVDGPEKAIEAIWADIERIRNSGEAAEADIAHHLRVAKRRLSFAVAVADITDTWRLDQVTGALSDFADAALSIVTAHLLRAGARDGAFSLKHEDDPERESGVTVLAVGKLGPRELNYSSDVDLIVLFDPDRIETKSPDRLQRYIVKLTRDLVRLMGERMADGYVFRTDLRLRPDPSATPLAMSLPAVETYYESLGQNWERAALIRARPVAGDLDAGAAFLDGIRPFIWRKNLDFAAIQDIHSIKRQINAHHGGGTIALGGHNIKLGRGGIREIEFFAQTQQLIWGGRVPELRAAGTLEALNALAAHGRITESAAEEMGAAYTYLRRVEHRLQMINDEQTHTLPESEAGLRNIAVFLGHADAAAFGETLLKYLRIVENHYAGLFEDAPSLTLEGDIGGNLVFTGADADPETLRTLKGLGFMDPSSVDAAVRRWHHGRYRSTRNTDARQILTELMPNILTALAATTNPDEAFHNFDEFLERLPAGIQLFSMFRSNPHLLALVAEIMGEAPRLARHLSQRPSTLDSVLGTEFFDALPSAELLEQDFKNHLAEAHHIEEVLDQSRGWAKDHWFQIGVQALRGYLTPRDMAAQLTNIAEVSLRGLRDHVEMELAERHGRFPDSSLVILALGKLGGREMTPTSDLDLIFVYTTRPGIDASDGPRPLGPTRYFARFSQRMINAVTAQTAEGRLYEVDMRLRPSGNAGPIASSLEAFIQYHDESAWTWEHMALTRARVIAGPAKLRREVEGVIRGVLTTKRDTDALTEDIADMRARMDKIFHTENVWDVKHLRGGLVDVEFITQYLQLRHAHDHPQILSQNTRNALEGLRQAQILDPMAGDSLIGAFDLWQGIQSILRLAIEEEIPANLSQDAPQGLRENLARVGGVDNFTALMDKITATAAQVFEIFEQRIGTARLNRR